ncbi:AEC family transporter [Pseudomonas mohnii]|jgi:malonate transporter
MNVLFSVVLPIFALVGAGWAARHYGFLGPTSARELNQFVVYLGIPALLFQVMANASWNDLNQPGFTLAFGTGCAITYALTVFIRCKQGAHLADASLDGLNGGYANVGFIGFPLCLAAFGSDSLPLVTITAILTVSVLFGLAVLLVEIGLQPKGNILPILGKVAISLSKNPMLLAPVLGVLYASFAPALPTGPNRFLSLLASAASPCALVSLGAFLGDCRGGFNWPRVSGLVALKLIFQPAVTWMAATYVFGLSHELTAIAVVVSALPTGTGPYMLANLYKRDAGTTAGSILASTLFSIASIAILISMFNA